MSLYNYDLLLAFNKEQIIEILRKDLKLDIDFDWVSDIPQTIAKKQQLEGNVGACLFAVFVVSLGLAETAAVFSMFVSLFSLDFSSFSSLLLTVLILGILLWGILKMYNKGNYQNGNTEIIEKKSWYALKGGVLYKLEYKVQHFERTIQKIYLFEITQIKLEELGIYIETAKQSWTIPTQQPIVLYELINQAKNESL